MAVKKSDLAFRLAKVTYVDYKTIEMDRVLLNLFPKLRFDGGTGRRRNADHLITVEQFVEYFQDASNTTKFPGFADHPEIVRGWLSTDLLDLVNRGRDNAAVVAPRPLHGSAYRYRTRHARDYYASDHLYWMLFHATNPIGIQARNELKRYIFDGLDLNTEKIRPTVTMDVETQAILLLPEHTPDTADSTVPESFPPLYGRQSDLLAEDVLRLLAYEKVMPRTALIEHLKNLFALHLALYHLTLLKLLPAMVAAQGAGPPPETASHIGLVLDCTGGRDARMAQLARTSAGLHFRRIPGYAQAHYLARNLDDMAKEQIILRNITAPSRGYFQVSELMEFLTSRHEQTRKIYFGQRLSSLTQQTLENGQQIPEVERVLELRRDHGLDEMETVIEILMSLRSAYHRKYITQCLDSFLLKNTESGLLRQLRAKDSPREFRLGSRVLELLLQLAVCSPNGGRFRTGEIRLEEFLTFLRDRYSLYVDALPLQDGFGPPSVEDHRALRRNVQAFKERLREVGYFQVMSDAYLSQTITPRYTIG